MYPFRRSGSSQLSAYWAALAAGRPESELVVLARSLDPTLLELVSRLRALPRDPVPDSAFVAHLERHLLDRVSQPAHSSRSSTSRKETSGTSASTWIKPPHGGHQTLVRCAQVVSACLLLLFLAYAIWQYGQQDGTSPGVIVPATSVSTPAATPVPREETLLNAIVSAENIPAGEGRLAGLFYVHVEPGSTGSWTGYCCPGLVLEIVISGTLTVSSQSSVQVLRADGELEAIPADSEFVLNAGDTWIYQNQSNFLSANNGSEPVEMVEWIYLDDPNQSFAGHVVPGWGGPGGLDVTSDLPLFSGDIELTLRHLNLTPDDGEGPPLAGTLRQFVVPNLEADILRTFGDGSFAAVDTQGELTNVFVLTVNSAQDDSDLPIVGVPPP